jgi:hypothetical protein
VLCLGNQRPENAIDSKPRTKNKKWRGSNTEDTKEDEEGMLDGARDSRFTKGEFFSALPK